MSVGYNLAHSVGCGVRNTHPLPAQCLIAMTEGRDPVRFPNFGDKLGIFLAFQLEEVNQFESILSLERSPLIRVWCTGHAPSYSALRVGFKGEFRARLPVPEPSMFHASFCNLQTDILALLSMGYSRCKGVGCAHGGFT
jgi:hypothetical protein